MKRMAIKTTSRRCMLAVMVLMTAALPWWAFAEDEASPQNLISNVVDNLVEVVAANEGDEAVDVRRTEMKKVIAPVFDFEEMAKRSLGYHWSKASEAGREEYVRLFSALLADTYLKRLEHIREGMVQMKGEQIKRNKALVKTMVDYKGDLFPINYKMVEREGDWKVYDVVVENIGLVTNYRNEFSGIIRKEKFDGLLARLRKKHGTTAKTL